MYIFSMKTRFVICTILVIVMVVVIGCGDNSPESHEPVVLYPECHKDATGRVDQASPQSMVDDWGQPVRIDAPINTLCPEDAIEISRDGHYLYFMFTTDILDSLSSDEILARENNTYRAERIGGPGEFGEPVYYHLARGTSLSLDGELSFTADGSKVYFHSNRPENTGYQHDPYYDDYIDIYVSDVIDSVPGPGRNLGPPVNSVYPDGEHAIHPDGVTLYFTSLRPPGGLHNSEIWTSTLNGDTWSEPERVSSINSIFNDLQPAFSADGDTMYFASDRNPLIGIAIYRSHRNGDAWSTPELVIQGIVGEPSLTADGQYLYFVHVAKDNDGVFDADVYYCERVTPAQSE